VRAVTRRVDFVNDDGRVARSETVRFVLRYVFKPEMELLLRQAGFGRAEVRRSCRIRRPGRGWRPHANCARATCCCGPHGRSMR